MRRRGRLSLLVAVVLLAAVPEAASAASRCPGYQYGDRTHRPVPTTQRTYPPGPFVFLRLGARPAFVHCEGGKERWLAWATRDTSPVFATLPGTWNVVAERDRRGRSLVQRWRTGTHPLRTAVRGTLVDAFVAATGDTVLAVLRGQRIALRRWRPGGRLEARVPGFPASVPASWRPDHRAEQEDDRVLLRPIAGTVLLAGGPHPIGARSYDTWPRAELNAPPPPPSCAEWTTWPGAMATDRWVLMPAQVCDRASSHLAPLDTPNSYGSQHVRGFSTPIGILGDLGLVLRSMTAWTSSLAAVVDVLDLAARRRAASVQAPLAPLRATAAPSQWFSLGPVSLRVGDAPCVDGHRRVTITGSEAPDATAIVALGEGYAAFVRSPSLSEPGRGWLIDRHGITPLDHATSFADPRATSQIVAEPTSLTVRERSGATRTVVPAPAAPQSWPSAGSCP